MLRYTAGGFGVEILGPCDGFALSGEFGGEFEGYPAEYPTPEGLSNAGPVFGYFARYTEGEADGTPSGVWYYFPTLAEIEEGYELRPV